MRYSFSFLSLSLCVLSQSSSGMQVVYRGNSENTKCSVRRVYNQTKAQGIIRNKIAHVSLLILHKLIRRTCFELIYFFESIAINSIYIFICRASQNFTCTHQIIKFNFKFLILCTDLLSGWVIHTIKGIEEF